MASIDDVIARSRQQGEFSERRRFTVARQSAIRKMRKFALADPSYYILELIQAAVANGATYIDIHAEPKTVALSYVGGGFAGEELAQIFDFLFASKDRLDLADIRQLALGINALLLAEPDAIVIESGKGTLESTTRIEVNPGANIVDVGTPTEALNGTYIRASGLNRSKLGSSKPREGLVIESRCLTAPVPVLFNNNPVFGYRTMRTPNLFGFKQTISFDEGDLYGTIGISRTQNQAVFKLLTFGVWIETVHEEIQGDTKFGGIVSFDRLRKSADHAGIVKDDVYRELWARIRPYARQLVEGKTGRAVLDIHELGGGQLTALEVRELGAKTGRLVAFPRNAVDRPELARLAAGIGEAIGGPVVLIGPTETATIELVAGDRVKLFQPALRDDALEFFERPEDALPERPWLTGVEKVEPITVTEFSTWLHSEGLVSNRTGFFSTLTSIPGKSVIEGSIVTPLRDHAPGQLFAQVRTSNRIVWQGPIQSSFPGHILVIDMPDVEARALTAAISGSVMNGAELIAEVYAQHALEALSRASLSVINSLSHRTRSADNAAARIALVSAARSTMKRIRNNGAGESLEFVLVDDGLPDEVLTYPVVRTLDGTERSIRDLQHLMDACAGLLYGVVPDVIADLEGLDRSRILDLDLASERAIIGLVGEASYVRVDARDVLVEREGVLVRDIATGLRDYPDDLPLLVEGEVDRLRSDPTLFEEITRELIRVYRGQRPALDQQEFRRQAARHLVWILSRVDQHDTPALRDASRLPLFLTASSDATTFEALMAAKNAHGRLPMLDGWAVDTARRSHSLQPLPTEDFVAAPVLAMNPFVFYAMREVGVTSAFDFELDEGDQTGDDVSFLVTTDQVEGLVGRLGVPRDPIAHPAIAVVDTTNQRVWALRTAANEFGIVGRLSLSSGGAERELEVVERRCIGAGFRLMTDLIDVLPELGEEDYDSATRHLLQFAARQLDFYREPDGKIAWTVRHPIATKVLNIPLFPTVDRIWATGERLIRAFVDAENLESEPGWQALLAADASLTLRHWCETILSSDAVISEPSVSAHVPPRPDLPATPQSTDDQEIAAWLEQAFDALRPEKTTARICVRIIDVAHDPDMRMGEGEAFRYSAEPQPLLFVRRDAPIVERVRAAGRTHESLTWLLMAGYAYVNLVLHEVTNEHEREFQARLIDHMQASQWS